MFLLPPPNRADCAAGYGVVGDEVVHLWGVPALLSVVPGLPDDIAAVIVAVVRRFGMVDADVLVLRTPGVLVGCTALLDMTGTATWVYEGDRRQVEGRVRDDCRLMGCGNDCRWRWFGNDGRRGRFGNDRRLGVLGHVVGVAIDCAVAIAGRRVAVDNQGSVGDPVARHGGFG